MNLITAQEVIDLCFNDRNFLAGKILDSHIQIAQEAYIRPVLGNDLFVLLTSDIPQGDNKYLVDSYIKQPLSWYVRYVILPEIMIHAANTGIQILQPQGAASASDKQAGLLREQAKSNGDILMRVAVQFIIANNTKYPLYDYQEASTVSSKVIGGVVFSRSMKRTPAVRPSIFTSPSTVIMLSTIQQVRDLVAHNAGDMVVCLGNNYIYEYDASSEIEDDGDLILKPANSLTGRWVKTKEIQTVNL